MCLSISTTTGHSQYKVPRSSTFERWLTPLTSSPFFVFHSKDLDFFHTEKLFFKDPQILSLSLLAYFDLSLSRGNNHIEWCIHWHQTEHKLVRFKRVRLCQCDQINFRPFITMKICPKAWKFAKVGSKICLSLVKLRQSGKFSPNLVTLASASVTLINRT